MVGVFEVALTKSTGRKEKDMQRKLKSGILELGDKVLVRETEVILGAEVIQRHENELTYTIKTTRNSSDITEKHVNACQPYIKNCR